LSPDLATSHRDDRGVDEMTALSEILERAPADAPTACAGWVAHDLMAHLAAGAAEMADLVELTLAAGMERPTRAMKEREAPYAAMDEDELRAVLRSQSSRLVDGIVRLAEAGEGATVPFAGRRSSAADLAMHGRSEAALHRWDLVGSDATSRELLSRPELTAHAVVVLNQMLDGSRESVAVRAREAVVGDLRARFAAPGQPDVVVTIDASGARLALADPDDDPTVVADPAARLLALWGRRCDPARTSWIGTDRDRTRLGAFLDAPARVAMPV
jgi:uncharacterized protein (TIGR03083 family)